MGIKVQCIEFDALHFGPNKNAKFYSLAPMIGQ